MKARRATGRVARGRITHAWRGAGLEIHSLKTRKAQRPTIQGRFRVNTDAPFAVGPSLIKRNDIRVDLRDGKKKVFITEPREAVFLLSRSHAREVVDFRSLDAKNVFSHRFGQWSLL